MSGRLKRKFIPWFLFHSLEFKWHYLGAFLCLYVLQELQSEIPEKIRNLTILLETNKIADASVWVFVGLALGILIFRTLSRLLFFYPARVQQKFLRIELLELLEKVPGVRLSKFSQGQVFQILFDDINNLRAFVGFGLLQICNILIAVWVLVPKLNNSDPYLWPAFIPLFLSVLFFSLMTFWNQKIFKQMLEKKGDLQQFLIESFEAKQTIKNFHREEVFIEKFKSLSNSELSLFFKSSIGYALTGPYVKLGLGASLIWATFLVRQKGGSSSDVVFFAGFLYLFLEPVMFLSWVAVVTSQGLAAWRRLKDLYSSISTESIEEKRLLETQYIVTDQTVVATFDFWHRSIELNVARGKWTILLGETGCGKSTLMSQLASLMILNHYKVSMVQQEPYLFNGTIRENIFLGRDSMEEQLQLVITLLQVFQLDHLLGDEKSVLDLEVGENGKRLSGGQMKRVALIRSLMSGADFYFWDDPFSSIDVILEKRIIHFLKGHSFWKSKTFFISSHRLTTVKLSDDLMMLKKELGIAGNGLVENEVKEDYFVEFFKEQMVEHSLD